MNLRHGLKILVVIVALVFIINLAKDLIRLWRAGDRLQQAKQNLSAEQAENARLKQEQHYLDSQFFFEQQVRDKLNMTKPGETIVILPQMLKPQRAEEPSQKGADTETLPVWQQWLALFW